MSAPPNQQRGRGRGRGLKSFFKDISRVTSTTEGSSSARRGRGRSRGTSHGALTPQGGPSAERGRGSSRGNEQPTNEPLQWAQTHWRDTFHNGSHSSLVMLDFLIKRREETYDAYLRKRSVILDPDDFAAYEARVAQGRDEYRDPTPAEFSKTKDWLLQFPDDDFDIVVNNGTGRCTSFAIQTARRLENQHSNVFDFDFYKLGIHHVARCKRTGILIDSSSKRGAFVLQPGEEAVVISEDRRWQNRWTFISPELSRFVKIRKNDSSSQISEATTPITWREAIHNCLIDVACKDTILIYFRSYPSNSDRPRYDSMIKWYVQDKLEIHFMSSSKDHNPDRVIFGSGDDRTNRQCRLIMDEFIQHGNGAVPFDKEFDKSVRIVNELWEAGIRVHGKPILASPRPGTSVEGSGNVLAGVWSATTSAAESRPGTAGGTAYQ